MVRDQESQTISWESLPNRRDLFCLTSVSDVYLGVPDSQASSWGTSMSRRGKTAADEFDAPNIRSDRLQGF